MYPSDSNPNDPGSPPVDEQDDALRQIAADAWADDAPESLTPRVLDKIRWGRRLRRTAIATGVTGVAAGLLIMATLKTTLPELGTETDPIDSSYLASSPPVVTLDLIADDQSAILAYLQTLDGELK